MYRIVTPALVSLSLLACSGQNPAGSSGDGTRGDGDSGDGDLGSGSGGVGNPSSGGATNGGSGGGDSSGACTNIQPTGTEWDEGTCDGWATATEECNEAWMVDGGYCNESCGRCTNSSTGGNGSGGSASGGNGSGGSASGGSSNGEHPKFVGNITTNSQMDAAGLKYSDYWDQVTPENAGKWGSVQPNAGSSFNWNTLDAIYDYSEDNGIIFKQHAFVWGSQQPSGTPTEAQVKNWIQSFCARYPKTQLIDVVNEPPPHTEPTYANNIGGGTNGNWQWITNSFKWAREYCPGAILILNDYNNIEWTGDNQHFINIVNTVLENGGPIDAVGAQSHDFDHASVSPQTVRNLLNKLHDDTGLPVYITELDLSYSDQAQQLKAYQDYFPMLMEADFVPGITIWGWIYGSTWSQAPDSGLVSNNGTARSSMTWLMNELGRPNP